MSDALGPIGDDDRLHRSAADADRPIRIGLIDDDVVDRLQVRRLIAADPGLDLVAESALASEAEIVAGQVDLLILDHLLPDGDGLGVLGRLRGMGRTLPVLALTGTRDDQVAAALIKGGADDYLAKDQLSGERLCHSIRTTVQAWRDRQASERANHALTDLAALAEVSDEICLPALVEAVARAWDAQACACLVEDDDGRLHCRASTGAPPGFASMPIPPGVHPQRQGDRTSIALRDGDGRARGLLAVVSAGIPHANALAVLRIAAARAVAVLERAEQRAHLEQAWRLERAVAAMARDLLANGGRRDPTVAMRQLLDGLDGERILLLAVDGEHLILRHQLVRPDRGPSAWTTLAWRPRLLRWRTELEEGAAVAGSLSSMHGDEQAAFGDDVLGSVALLPLHEGDRLTAVLRMDARNPRHWNRDRLRSLRHAAQLIQAWWSQDPLRAHVQS